MALVSRYRAVSEGWCSVSNAPARRVAPVSSAPMTERGLPNVDGSPACPFVAFEDDRDARSASPDHRHRCYAEEGAPAPRAAAHQEAYCLSSAFPVCPTFQAWARREAARAKESESADRERDREARPIVAPTGAEEWTRPPEADDAEDAGESTPRRNPPRDWAAPPPWAPGAGPAGGAGTPARSVDARPSFVGRQPEAGQGLAGSAADRLAGGGDVTPRSASAPPSAAGGAIPDAPRPSVAPGAPDDLDPEIAGLVARPGLSSRARPAPDEAATDRGAAVRPPPPRGQPVSSTRSDRGREPARVPPREHVQGPSWERARRNEAYPTIRTRAGLDGLPGVPRAVLLFGALIIAAVALFFLPAFLGIGGPETPGAASSSPSASIAAPTATPAPTPEPEPTPQTYTIKQGDTLSKIARSFGLTLDQLLAANTETIVDANKITVGDVIIIPVAPPDEVPDGGSAEPTG